MSEPPRMRDNVPPPVTIREWTINTAENVQRVILAQSDLDKRKPGYIVHFRDYEGGPTIRAQIARHGFPNLDLL